MCVTVLSLLCCNLCCYFDTCVCSLALLILAMTLVALCIIFTMTKCDKHIQSLTPLGLAHIGGRIGTKPNCNLWVNLLLNRLSVFTVTNLPFPASPRMGLTFTRRCRDLGKHLHTPATEKRCRVTVHLKLRSLSSISLH